MAMGVISGPALSAEQTWTQSWSTKQWEQDSQRDWTLIWITMASSFRIIDANEVFEEISNLMLQSLSQSLLLLRMRFMWWGDYPTSATEGSYTFLCSLWCWPHQRWDIELDGSQVWSNLAVPMCHMCPREFCVRPHPHQSSCEKYFSRTLCSWAPGLRTQRSSAFLGKKSTEHVVNKELSSLFSSLQERSC